MSKTFSQIVRKRTQFRWREQRPFRVGLVLTIVLVIGLIAAGGIGVDTAFAQEAETQDTSETATVIPVLPSTNINVRSGPSTDDSIIRTALAGTQVTVLGQDTTGTWLFVEFDDGTQGWIARYLTNFTIGVPAVTTPPLAPPASTSNQTTDANSAMVLPTQPNAILNVRSGPSTAYNIIRTVPSGTQLTVLGQDATSAWLSVQLADGTQGWVARFLTDFTAAVPAVTTPPLAAPATTSTQLDTATIVTALPTTRVNVRSGPSTAYSVIRTVANGVQVTVLGQDATSTWLSVQLADGTQGWVARFLTNFGAAVPTVTTPPLAAPATTSDQAVLDTAIVLPTQPNAILNVHSGPSTAYGIIDTVPSGTQAMVLGQNATGAWLWVRFSDGTEGWIARYLTDFKTAVQTVTATADQPPLAPPATTVEIEPGVLALPGEAGRLVDPPVQEALDANRQILSEGEIQWYAFQHPGDTSTIQIWMDVEPNEGAGFAVFPEEEARAVMAGADPEEFSIGNGTPNPNEPGDLFWRANFEEHGTYYVMVQHRGTGDVTYSLYGRGPNFSTP